MRKFEDLTKPDEAAEALKHTGVGAAPVHAEDLEDLPLTEADFVATMAEKGIKEPRKLLDRVERAVAANGDADGLYTNADRIRAMRLLNAANGDKDLY